MEEILSTLNLKRKKKHNVTIMTLKVKSLILFCFFLMMQEILHKVENIFHLCFLNFKVTPSKEKESRGQGTCCLMGHTVSGAMLTKLSVCKSDTESNLIDII